MKLFPSAQTGPAISKDACHWARVRTPFVQASFIMLLVAPVLPLNTISASAAEPATITYSQDFPGSDPEHYSISVSADGHGTYESSRKISEDSDRPQTYQAEFNLSPRSRMRVFELAKEAKFFAGKIDSGNSKLAFTGSKTLSYRDGRANHTATYNYSHLPAAQQLTALFQNLSATLEYGRRLTYYHQYQKLALDEELKRMEQQAKDGQLSEIDTVRPVLQEIVADASVINVVRARAQRIMASDEAKK